MRIAALSIDAALARELQCPLREARVHSVFERVINIAVGPDRLLTLAWRGADDAPESAVVDVDTWSGLCSQTAARVHLDRRRILIGADLSIDLGSARQWQCELPRFAHDTALLATNLPRALEHLECFGRGVGAGPRAPRSATGLDLALADAFRRSTQGLVQAITSDDEASARAHVEQLVGLGPGLTPAGDDFLVGLLASLNLTGSPCHAWRRIGAWAVELAARRTHLISATALRQAACGRVRAHLIDLCQALMHASPPMLRLALERVLAIGSGSGSDIAAGLLAGFDLHLHAA